MGSKDELLDLVVAGLESMSLANSYASEERDFMPDVIAALEETLRLNNVVDFTLSGSIGGVNRARVDLLGTNFWPDVELVVKGQAVVAIELKLGRKGLASVISQTLGQLLIYQLKYPYVVGFVAHNAKDYPKLHLYDAAFHNLCESQQLRMVVRKLGDA